MEKLYSLKEIMSYSEYFNITLNSINNYSNPKLKEVIQKANHIANYLYSKLTITLVTNSKINSLYCYDLKLSTIYINDNLEIEAVYRDYRLEINEKISDYKNKSFCRLMLELNKNTSSKGYQIAEELINHYIEKPDDKLGVFGDNYMFDNENLNNPPLIKYKLNNEIQVAQYNNFEYYINAEVIKGMNDFKLLKIYKKS